VPEKGEPAETPKRLAPKQDTLRELFLKSGNLCAFRGCDAILLDEDGTFTAQICHIEAAEPGGERFNPNMTNEERRAFPNLILLCYRHHQITNDVGRHDVASFKAMKAAHEHRFAGPDRPMLEKLSKAKWYTLVGSGAAAGLGISGIAQQIRSAFNALVRSPRESDSEPKSLREELLNVLRYAPRGTVHCYSRDPLHLAVGEAFLELFEKSGWHIDRLQAPLPIEVDDAPDYNTSMMMLFTVRDPHQHSNAKTAIEELFDICGFERGQNPDVTTGVEGGRTLRFYVPVGVKRAR